MITTIAALVLIIVSFIETQINFYLLNKSQIAHKKRRNAERKNRQLYVVNDQSADLEYVIPKVIIKYDDENAKYLYNYFFNFRNLRCTTRNPTRPAIKLQQFSYTTNLGYSNQTKTNTTIPISMNHPCRCAPQPLQHILPIRIPKPTIQITTKRHRHLKTDPTQH